MAKNKINKVIDGFFWLLNLAMGGLFIFVVVAGYLALRPKFPKIASPEALVAQCSEFAGEPLPWALDMVDVSSEQWPPAIAALRPRYVFLATRRSADKQIVVDYVDIVISTGGIGGNYGYFVCFVRKGEADTVLVRGRSDVIFENESGYIVRYIASH